MKLRSSLFALLLALPLAACAAPAQNQSGGKASGKKVKCEYESVTGSHIQQMICREESDAEARKQNDQEAMRDMQNQGNPRRSE